MKYLKKGSLALMISCFVLALGISSCGGSKRSVSQRDQAAYTRKYRPKKHEMRAAWLQTVYRSDYARMSTHELQKHLLETLDRLKSDGFNTVIFQVRAEADAWYRSPFEPWSRTLTGLQGLPPDPEWDPMDFLIEACHRRGLDFHAWINPYRASTNTANQLSEHHPYHRHPEWFMKYKNLLLFNPSLPECREYICQIVHDIVSRYDVDAIHMDDYFYPYPVAGVSLNDEIYFNRDPRGFTSISDWRRDNVNLLIRDLHHTIKRLKPYVQLGISPFGIYRNERTAPGGSKTTGLQNYDDLFADVLLWDRNHWVDYIMPQLYWQMGHKVADFTELAYWWQHNIKNADYYIGQNVKVTMDHNQLHPKMIIASETSQGNCMWPGSDVLSNYKGISTQLAENYWALPALLPPLRPEHELSVYNLQEGWTPEGRVLTWQPAFSTDPKEGGYKYFVVYCFDRRDRKKDRSDPDNIVAITREPLYLIPDLGGKMRVTYIVTQVDRFNAESIVGTALDTTL